MRTRNFRARNDVVEGGSVAKGQRGNKTYVERKVGDCFQWKAHGQCSKGDYCSFRGQRRKRRSSCPASHTKAKQTDGEEQQSSQGSGNKQENSCRFPPVCLNYKSEKGCVHGDKGHFRHVEAEGKPNKKSKKGGAKGSVAILKESIQLGCVSQKINPRKFILHQPGKLAQNTPSNFQRHLGPNYNSGKKGSIARCYPKVCAS